jgi:hypothetical protein
MPKITKSWPWLLTVLLAILAMAMLVGGCGPMDGG